LFVLAPVTSVTHTYEKSGYEWLKRTGKRGVNRSDISVLYGTMVPGWKWRGGEGRFAWRGHYG